MKKFWVVLLALGLVAGFAMSASAADVKFSGSYYVTGIYIDNPDMKKQGSQTAASQAYYFQRLRIQTEFKIAEGLSLVTRFDALEKPWGYGKIGTGGAPDSWRTAGALANSFDVTNRSSQGAAGARAQENIEFERAYIDFTTKIGRFNVGYQNFIAWGTMFLDTHVTRPGIKYFVPIGPVTVVAAIEKTVEQNASTTYGVAADADANVYDLGVIYKFGAGEAGILWQYGDNRSNRQLGYKTQLHIFDPYVKAKFGPIYVEAEGVYGTGKLVDSENPAIPSVDGEALGLYINAKVDIGPAYVGGIFAYMRGDDPSTTNKVEGSLATALTAGQAWDPLLILWNDALYGGNFRVATPVGVFFDNAWLYQIYAGFKPVKEADIMLSVTYAYADKKPYATAGVASSEYVSDVYGTEVDLTAKYKIFDNLEYMVGAGYLFTGNFFKKNINAAPIDNNYMLFHRLTLSF
jgi:hypothetical protein